MRPVVIKSVMMNVSLTLTFSVKNSIINEDIWNRMYSVSFLHLISTTYWTSQIYQ